MKEYYNLKANSKISLCAKFQVHTVPCLLEILKFIGANLQCSVWAQLVLLSLHSIYTTVQSLKCFMVDLFIIWKVCLILKVSVKMIWVFDVWPAFWGTLTKFLVFCASIFLSHKLLGVVKAQKKHRQQYIPSRFISHAGVTLLCTNSYHDYNAEIVQILLMEIK